MVNLTQNKITETMRIYLIIGLYLYKMKGASQAALIIFTALATVPLLETFQKFIIPSSFDNWIVFLVLLFLDTASGMLKHSGIWGNNEPNTLNKDDFFLKLFRKVFVGAVWLILINVITSLDNSSAYFDTFGAGSLISWLGWSIASNLYIVSGSTFPPAWIMSKFKKANEDDDFDENQT